VARALVTGRSRTFGVVSFDTTLYGPACTLLGIERAAHAASYFTIVASLGALSSSLVSEAVERLSLHGVDGIMVIAPYEQGPEALRHTNAGSPCCPSWSSAPAAGLRVAASPGGGPAS
jgi:DNA-binding LacI/PurR family transcriptional regulator